MEGTEQAVEPTVSVEDKIADIFAGKVDKAEEAAAPDVQAEQSEDTGEEAVSEESEELVEVEFDGDTFKVPPKLKDALMRESDYTQKTQTLSSQRKELDLQQKEIVLAREREAFNESVRDELNQVQMLEAYISHASQNTDWSTMTSEQMFRTKLELDNLEKQKTLLNQSLAQKWQTFKGHTDKKRAEIRAEAEKVLSGVIPKWSENKGKIEAYIKGLGYPEPALESMSSLDYQVAYKAMQFDALKSKTKDAVKQASTAAIKPTSRKEMPKGVQKKLNYRHQVQRAQDPQTREKLAQERLADIFGG